jgi:hypothetical protein
MYSNTLVLIRILNNHSNTLGIANTYLKYESSPVSFAQRMNCLLYLKEYRHIVFGGCVFYVLASMASILRKNAL